MCQSQEAHLYEYVIVNTEILPCVFSEIIYAYQEMQKQVFGDNKVSQCHIFSWNIYEI